ncbi:protein interacting with APP tail-1 isoform X2 [Lycorma delicatula]|uniref:protein interacting with APP tail-1 isoform X2 n=1 Tax=Lycorma delicatula TaxID=130591 RepID=UPI003F513440
METFNIKMPCTLYELSIKSVIDYFQYYDKNDLRMLPENILFDVYFMLYKENMLCPLYFEFSDLDVFVRMLKLTNKRLCLLKSFQALMDHGTPVAKTLANSYVLWCSLKRYETFGVDMKPAQLDSVIHTGIKVGGFLSEAGWFFDSEKILSACRDLCLKLPPCAESWRVTLECCHKLLHAQASFSLLDAAMETQKLAEELVQKLMLVKETMNLAGLYTVFSLNAFCRSDYDEAFRWSVEALKELGPGVSPRVMIDSLSQAAKACVVKREFTKADLLVRQAVCLAREAFGPDHPKFADTLQDYGFYLLNSDSIRHSVHVYGEALKLKMSAFGKSNLHIAAALEDLAYALYVHEYSSGRFDEARDHSEKAIEIMEKLLPAEHLMLASAQRVKALILEEIALDSVPNSSETQNELLGEAEKLHKNALRLSRLAFGEDNVQTAKHYGNLGRLYQSMKKYNEAETMHLKAIAIKEKLLGEDDYEVGLSVGHLASLYNYHMKQYRKAEKLYFRSIDINLKLFGHAYSGLEYDYRGLIHVYELLGDAEKWRSYTLILSTWKDLREQHALLDAAPLALTECPQPLDKIKQVFFESFKTNVKHLKFKIILQ